MEKASVMTKIENYFNTFNHMAIGMTAIYLSWLCWQAGPTKISLHTWLCTIGYQTLMAEAIMALYSENNWSRLHRKRSKNHIHWVMQVVGSALAIAGVFVEFSRSHGPNLRTYHGITGFVSFILLFVSCANGISALFAHEIRKCVKPVYSKFFHNFIGISAFVIGMVSLYYGWEKGFTARVTGVALRQILQGLTIFTIIFSCVGALKSCWSQLRGIFARD